MKLILEKRKLSEKEIDALVEEIKKFPNPLTGKKTWTALEQVYIALSQREIIGVCGVSKLDNWIKLGPYVVFEKYHGQGYGKKILESIVKDYPNANLFIGSRNPRVATIAKGLGFNETLNIWTLPNTIKLYLVKNILQNLTIDFIKEFIRKKPTQEGPYRFFLKHKIFKTT